MGPAPGGSGEASVMRYCRESMEQGLGTEKAYSQCGGWQWYLEMLTTLTGAVETGRWAHGLRSCSKPGAPRKKYT